MGVGLGRAICDQPLTYRALDPRHELCSMSDCTSRKLQLAKEHPFFFITRWVHLLSVQMLFELLKGWKQSSVTLPVGWKGAKNGGRAESSGTGITYAQTRICEDNFQQPRVRDKVKEKQRGQQQQQRLCRPHTFPQLSVTKMINRTTSIISILACLSSLVTGEAWVRFCGQNMPVRPRCILYTYGLKVEGFLRSWFPAK